MQYYNSQGDATHKGLYPGKMPVGCVIEYLEKLCVPGTRPVAGAVTRACTETVPQQQPYSSLSVSCFSAVASSACFKLNKLSSGLGTTKSTGSR